VTAEPTVAVVIPTHDRRTSLRRCLHAFARQSYPADLLEIIVVADGCSDGTAQLAQGRTSVPLRILEQPRQGQAIARNRGADVSTADLLIFADDDVEVEPGFVAAHVEAHRGSDQSREVIGNLPPDVQNRRDFFAIMLRAWWEAMFEPMRDPGHRFSYSDLLSGNFSIGRSYFERVGRFDGSLRCHEDYEFGYRLIAAGAEFAFAERAAGRHHEHTDLARALQRKRDEGAADVALARRHPELVSSLPLCRRQGDWTRRARLLQQLALSGSTAGDVIEGRYRAMLPVLEAARFRSRWRRLLDDLLMYWYWRGVGESLEPDAVARMCGSTPTHDAPPYELDLRPGLCAAMHELDRHMPQSVRLRWGSLVIGTVPPQPGAEALRGRHLPSLLRRFTKALGEVLTAASAQESDCPPAADESGVDTGTTVIS
jgi:glycosyltransferase involved in cell wall biosynthesis